MKHLAALSACALYALYVALQVPAVGLPALAIAFASIALAFVDPERAWLACGAVVVAVLHARALAPTAAFGAIQIGLAAFVCATASLSLVTPKTTPSLGAVVAISIVVALLVAASAGLVSALAGIVAGALAGARPFAAAVVVSGRAPTDPWLAWSPIGGR